MPRDSNRKRRILVEQAKTASDTIYYDSRSRTQGLEDLEEIQAHVANLLRIVRNEGPNGVYDGRRDWTGGAPS